MLIKTDLLCFISYPRLKQSLLTFSKIILGVITYIAAIAVAKYLAAPTIESVTEADSALHHALKNLSELTAVIIAYIFYFRVVEKRFSTELNFKGKYSVYALIAGFSIISVTSIILFATGLYDVDAYQRWTELHLVFIALTCQAISGEILFRGIFFRLTEQQLGTAYTLIFIPIAYGLVNIAVDGLNLVVLVSTILISALWSCIYILSRNLWVTGLFVAGWLYAVFLTGILDEHWRTSAPVISHSSGPELLTGASFGPEASIVTIVLVSMSLIFLMKLIKEKDQLVNMPRS